jgi:hypothetical protein
MFRSSLQEALSFVQPRRKEVSSFEHVLIFAGNDWSRDITQGKEVSDQMGIGPSVHEIMSILEYVFVGIRK